MDEVDNLIAPFLEIGKARHAALRTYRLLQGIVAKGQTNYNAKPLRARRHNNRKTTIKRDYSFIISISSSSSYIIVVICLFQQSAQKFSSAISFCSKVMSFVPYISLQMTQMFVGILNTSPHQIKRRDLKVSVISLCRSRWVIMPT